MRVVARARGQGDHRVRLHDVDDAPLVSIKLETPHDVDRVVVKHLLVHGQVLTGRVSEGADRAEESDQH